MTETEVKPISKINVDEIFESLLSTIAPDLRAKAKEKIIQTLSNYQINYESLSDVEKNIFDKLKDKRSFDKMPETMLLNLVKNMEVMDFKPKTDCESFVFAPGDLLRSKLQIFTFVLLNST